VPSMLYIWDEIMIKIHEKLLEGENIKSFSEKELLYLPYCKDSGELYSDACRLDPRGDRCEYGYFSADNRPSKACSRHITVTVTTPKRGMFSEKTNVRFSLIRVERNLPINIFVSDSDYIYDERNIKRLIKEREESQYFYPFLQGGEFLESERWKKHFLRILPGH